MKNQDRMIAIFVPAAAVGGLAGLGLVGYRVGRELTGTVAGDRWLMVGSAVATAVVVGVAVTLVLAAGHRPKRTRPGWLTFLSGGAALLGLLAGVQYVPALKAPLLAAELAHGRPERAALEEPLLPEGPACFDADVLAARLERVVHVGEEWLLALYGPDKPARGPGQPGPRGILPLVWSFGMGPYGALVDAELPAAGWTAVPPSAGVIRYAGPKAQVDRLQALKDRVDRLAATLRRKQDATGVTWLGRWVEEYERQAHAIVLQEVKEPSTKPEIRALFGLNADLTRGLFPWLQLPEKERADAAGAARRKALAETKLALPAWESAARVVPRALAAAADREEAEEVAAYLKELATLVENYNYVAKHAGYWAPGDGGLKSHYQALQAALVKGGGQGGSLIGKPGGQPLAGGVAALREALTRALASDAAPAQAPPPPGAGQNGKGRGAPGDAWTADQIWYELTKYLDTDNWGDAQITVDGKRKPVVEYIKAHFDADFRAGSPPPVSYPAWPRREARKRALAIAARYVKIYAGEVAADWARRVEEVRKEKPNEAAGQVYTLRRRIRALFTEDPILKTQLDAVKAILNEIGFPFQHVDVQPAGAGAAGRTNAAVEEVGKMVDQFVARLREAASEDAPADPKRLLEGGGWWSIFMAGDRPGLSPFSVLIRIRTGIPVKLPARPDGSPARNPDGTYDWSKASGPFEGGVEKLGGKDFRSLLEAREPPADDAATPPGAKPGGPAPGPAKPVKVSPEA